LDGKKNNVQSLLAVSYSIARFGLHNRKKRLQLDAARRSYRLPIRRDIIIGKLPGVRDQGENTINKRNCSARNYCRI